MDLDRSKTAISRSNFSTPVQHLLERMLLTKNRSFFDYGCGKGDDVAGLIELGFNASGWDPAFKPNTTIDRAEIINLGFVLNVIENPSERISVLKKAWELADGALMISVISKYDMPGTSLNRLNDGYVSNAGSFQKYYEPGELKNYVDEILDIESLPVTPFQVLCFKNEDYEQSYLATSSSSFRTSSISIAPIHPLRKSRISKCIEDFIASDQDAWEEIIGIFQEYGISPPVSYFSSQEILQTCGVTSDDLLHSILEMYGEHQSYQTVQKAKNSLLVQLALAFFRGKPKSKHYSVLSREAIKAHFGSFSNALEKSRSILFSIGDPKIISDLCDLSNIGIEDEQALYVHRSCIPHLHPILQTYIQVGQLFYCDLSAGDIFKIHKMSGKLTLLIYDDYEELDEPILNRRIKIDYPKRRISFYDHRSENQRLIDKKAYEVNDI